MEKPRSHSSQVKKDDPEDVPFSLVRGCLQNLDVLCLPALGALGHVELHSLTFLQTLEAIRLDGGEVNEHVLTILAAQKSEPFCIVKPFHCSLFHVSLSLVRNREFN